MIKTVEKAHKNFFGELSTCFINEDVYYGDFYSKDYEEKCSMAENNTVTLFDEKESIMLTICNNHIAQVKEDGIKHFLIVYSDDFNAENYDVDLMEGDPKIEEILELIKEYEFNDD